ncbi:efflux RND transporter periplasmic adaptor subunit [Kiritimatiellaeota bacterium B1221]|nr:efflux RND transporter periplasmic adaptor subunit [Kiritimatiellaeota bacterium B1221]
MKKSTMPLSLFTLSLLALTGCGKNSSAGAPPAPPPPLVKVLEAQAQSASPVNEYIARVEPIQQVNLPAQISGIVKEVHFKEGSRVKQGECLFSIDPASFEAAVAMREAELEQAKAGLDRAEKYLAMLDATDSRSVSKSDRNAAEADVAEGRAMKLNAEAALRQAKIDLGYTQINSPIDGRIGRALITKGNLVSAASGPLATVIQTDPIRIVVALPDAEYITAFHRYSMESDYNPKITIRLGNGMMYPHEGEIEFDDNQMNAATGTIAVRVRFPNPDRLLVANNYVTVQVQDPEPVQKILVPAESVMHNTEGSYVWVVAEDNTVSQAPVETGANIGTDRIIDKGLTEGQRVVFAGMQKLRPGMQVTIAESPKSE